MDQRSLLKAYAPDIPPFLFAAANAPEMRRLRDVGMNCGCEYTSFPLFTSLPAYTRFDHSLGVGLLVWRFTQNPKQALAGLLHDIATPTFSHVVDFLRGDYLKQEATEDGTRERIDASPELQGVLGSLGLCTDDVCDYHRYPIADNKSPRLSADRLEYSLGNMFTFGFRDPLALQSMLKDIHVAKNEAGEVELCFSSLSTARDFADGALACSRIYVSDVDRYAMQILSELLRDALQEGVIQWRDLDGTEPTLIRKLQKDPLCRSRWQDFRAMHQLAISDTPTSGVEWRCISAKKRYIDPFVSGQGRLSRLDAEFREELEIYLSRKQDYWIRHI